MRLGKKSNKLFRYGIVGVASFAIELIFIYIFRLLTGDAIFAVAISFWFGLFSSFLLQKVITFNDARSTKKTWAKQMLLYLCLVCLNYAFTIIFVSLLHQVVGLFTSRTIALIITTGWNYILYSKLIFKK
jgi:putative flippase GtrA